MHPATYNALENIDAAVFSSDFLETDLQIFQEYVDRWNRAIAEHNCGDVEEAEEEPETDELTDP